MAPALGSWISGLLGSVFRAQEPTDHTDTLSSPTLSVVSPVASSNLERSPRVSSSIVNKQRQAPASWSGRLRNGESLPESPDSIQRSYDLLDAVLLQSKQLGSGKKASKPNQASRPKTWGDSAGKIDPDSTSSPPARYVRHSHRFRVSPKSLKASKESHHRLRRHSHTPLARSKRIPRLIKTESSSQRSSGHSRASVTATTPATVPVLAADSHSTSISSPQTTNGANRLPANELNCSGIGKPLSGSSHKSPNSKVSKESERENRRNNRETITKSNGLIVQRNTKEDSSSFAGEVTPTPGKQPRVSSLLRDGSSPGTQSIENTPQPRGRDTLRQVHSQNSSNPSQSPIEHLNSRLSPHNLQSENANYERRSIPSLDHTPDPKRRKTIMKKGENHHNRENIASPASGSVIVKNRSGLMNPSTTKLPSTTFRQNLFAHMSAIKDGERTFGRLSTPNTPSKPAFRSGKDSNTLLGSATSSETASEVSQAINSPSKSMNTPAAPNHKSAHTDLHLPLETPTSEIKILRRPAGRNALIESDLLVPFGPSRPKKRQRSAVDSVARNAPYIPLTRVSEAVIGDLVAPDTDQHSDSSSDCASSIQNEPRSQQLLAPPSPNNIDMPFHAGLDGPASHTQSMLCYPAQPERDRFSGSMPLFRGLVDGESTPSLHISTKAAFSPELEAIYVLDTTPEPSSPDDRSRGPNQTQSDAFPFHSIKEEYAPLPPCFTLTSEPTASLAPTHSLSREAKMDGLRLIPSVYGTNSPIAVGAQRSKVCEPLYVAQNSLYSSSPVSRQVYNVVDTSHQAHDSVPSLASPLDWASADQDPGSTIEGKTTVPLRWPRFPTPVFQGQVNRPPTADVPGRFKLPRLMPVNYKTPSKKHMQRDVASPLRTNLNVALPRAVIGTIGGTQKPISRSNANKLIGSKIDGDVRVSSINPTQETSGDGPAHPRYHADARTAGNLQVHPTSHLVSDHIAQTRKLDDVRRRVLSPNSPGNAAKKVSDVTIRETASSSPSRNHPRYRGMQNAPVVSRNGKRTILFNTSIISQNSSSTPASLLPMQSRLQHVSPSQESNPLGKQAHLGLLFSSPPTLNHQNHGSLKRLDVSRLISSPKNDLVDG